MVTVEFALVITLFVLAALFCFSALLQFATALDTDNSAREVARAVALGKDRRTACTLAETKNSAPVKKCTVRIAHGIATVEIEKAGRGVFSLLGQNFSAMHKVAVEPGAGK